MAEFTNPAKGVIPASSLLLILLTVGGIVLHEKPFRSSRPSEQKIDDIAATQSDQVIAPQWDDPFKETSIELSSLNVQKDLDELSCEDWDHGLGTLRNQVDQRIDVDANAKVRVLHVLTASGFTHNAVEVRRRQRAAMAQALVSNGYAPDTPGKIGFVAVPEVLITDAGIDPGNGYHLMPYEWFGRGRISVLVLWSMGSQIIPDEASARVNIEVVLNSVIAPRSDNKVQAKIIGPSSSSELKKLFSHETRGTAGGTQSPQLSPRIRKREESARQQIGALAEQAWPGPFCNPDFVYAPSSQATPQDPQDDEANATRPADDAEPPATDTTADKGFAVRIAELRSSVHCDLEDVEQVAEVIRELSGDLQDADPDWALTLGETFLYGHCPMKNAAASDRKSKGPEPSKSPDQDTGMEQEARSLIKDSLFFSSPEALTAMTLDYLDVYPDPDRVEKISQCMPRFVAGSDTVDTAWIAACLKGSGVTDSDETWFETVALMLQAGEFILQQAFIYQADAMPKEERDFAAFVLLGEAYLDWGWPILPDLPDPFIEVEEIVVIAATEPGLSEAAQPAEMIRFDQLEVISPRATLDSKQLFGQEQDFEKLIRTIATDTEVTRVLVRELRSRGIDLCSSDTKIALFLEGDSIYGSKYPQTFLNSFECPSADAPKASLQVSYYFSRTEGDTRPSGGAGVDPTRALASGDLSALETSNVRQTELPTGAHQLDYIRRLAKSLPPHNNEIAAIGLIGADVYDKQLIIEAIRTYLPGTLIFTTDADALYAHPKFYRYNQNLLVASAYGLTARDTLEYKQDELEGATLKNQLRSTIAFRDNYQTSFFVAALTAIKGQRPKCEPTALFEVGRSGLVDITPRPENKKTYCVDNKLQEHSPDRDIRWAEFGFQLPFLLGPIILLQVFLLRSRKQVPAHSTRQSHAMRRRRINQLVLLNRIALVGMAIFLVFWKYNPSFEPLYLFEGISAAPTVIFRVSAIMFSLSLILFIESRVQANGLELSRYFNLREGQDEASHKPTWLERIRDRIHTSSISEWESELAGKLTRSRRTDQEDWSPPTAQEIWSRYTRLGRFWPRVYRIALPLLALLVAAFFIAYRIFAEPYLVRYNTFEIPGLPHALNAFDLLILVSVCFSIAAVMLAGDALRLCTVFVRYHEYDFIEWKRLPNRGVYRELSDYAGNRLASVEMIMRRSEVMRMVIIFPFIVLFMQVAARSNLFEGWTWNPGVISIYAGFAIYLFYRTTRLQQAANRARRSVLTDLKRETSNLRMSIEAAKARGATRAEIDPEFGSGDIKHLERSLASTREVITHVNELQRGLFRPVMDHPLFQAIAWPSTGLGLLALLQVLL